MKRFVPAAALVLSLIPFAASAEEVAKPAEPTATVAPAPAPLPFLGAPEPILTSSCRAVAMTSCDNGQWLVCEGNVQCDAGWKWVYCDGQSWACPECSWGAPCL